MRTLRSLSPERLPRRFSRASNRIPGVDAQQAPRVNGKPRCGESIATRLSQANLLNTIIADSRCDLNGRTIEDSFSTKYGDSRRLWGLIDSYGCLDNDKHGLIGVLLLKLQRLNHHDE